MRRGLWITLAVLLAMVVGGAALIRLAGAEATEFRVAGPVLHISGPISGAASDRLERLLEEYPGISVVALGDIPGADDVAWVAGMGRMIRFADLATQVSGTVVNDAIFLFLGGTTRSVEGGALVLQSDTVQRQMGVSVDASAATEAERARFVAAMLGAPDFAAFMAQTRATRDSYVLTEDDITRFGLLTTN